MFLDIVNTEELSDQVTWGTEKVPTKKEFCYNKVFIFLEEEVLFRIIHPFKNHKNVFHRWIESFHNYIHEKNQDIFLIISHESIYGSQGLSVVLKIKLFLYVVNIFHVYVSGFQERNHK